MAHSLGRGCCSSRRLNTSIVFGFKSSSRAPQEEEFPSSRLLKQIHRDRFQFKFTSSEGGGSSHLALGIRLVDRRPDSSLYVEHAVDHCVALCCSHRVFWISVEKPRRDREPCRFGTKMLIRYLPAYEEHIL